MIYKKWHVLCIYIGKYTKYATSLRDYTKYATFVKINIDRKR